MDNNFKIKSDALRLEAEAHLASIPVAEISLSSAEELLQELQVHQIELEMQNENLRQAHMALEVAHNRYVDLFEFAPVGYMTLNFSGTVHEINLTGCALLKVERKNVLNRRFSKFIASEDTDAWHRHFTHAKQLSEVVKHPCDLKMLCADGSSFFGHLDCLYSKSGESSAMLRITLTDITKIREAADEIQHLAYYDLVTRLPNRRLLMDRLQHALEASLRSGHKGALLFLDLDNFKMLNDTRGHDIGDLLLQQVAQRLSSCARKGDTVARLGGDEFVVMLEELSEHELAAADQAKIVGEKILTILNQPYQLAAQVYRNSTSIGVTLFSGQEQTIDELLKQADIAMYQVKHDGRNALRFFDPLMQQTINSRATLESELRLALEAQQFRLYYQTQVNSERQTLGAEVLIRWMHPVRGLISPDQFIPLTEETGLILPIGKWVLEMACTQLKAWQAGNLTRHLTLSVNVSARQFHEPGFVSQVQTAVKSNAINPALLKLEPTESILMKDIEATVVIMNALKAIGVQFELNEFGTGFSSLQYLKKMPLNQIKIDQSFVRDLVTDDNDQAIVRTIIAMAGSLNFEVIAEGVETAEQLHILQSNGCNHFQGYLFGKPVPIEQFEALLRKR